jgi:lipopolysaccharide/colanic/teichoic acid biosynthesis glycosyltransferase
MTGETKTRNAKLRSIDTRPGDLRGGAVVRLDFLSSPELRVVEDKTSASTRMRRLAAHEISQTVTVSNPRGKRLFDIVAASLLSLAFLPLIAVIVVTIRAGGSPVLFRHRRIGRQGRVFHCLKFRTMVPDAEVVLRKLLDEHPEIRNEWTENHKLRHDPRITLIGRFLRFTSLDELPQLWNVLRGDMSLVGPRPIVRAELLRYGREVALYLAVKPGLTGLWQIKGRSDTTYRRRVAMDKYYVMHQNMLLDLYIVAATAGAVLRRAGAY